MQSALDAERIISIGAPKDRVEVTGNMKFDIDVKTDLKAIETLKEMLSLKADEELMVAGSTHSGEENIILEAFKELLNEFPKLRLLIAPRHPKRSKAIVKLAAGNDLMAILVSGISGTCPSCINKPVFILDTIGELLNYYAAADIVFVGGSLVKTGGHNIIEPASFRKPIIFGPQMFNFRDISKVFLKNNAAYLVHDENELTAKIKEILSNDFLARELAERAYGLIINNRGATKKNIQVIRQMYK